VMITLHARLPAVVWVSERPRIIAIASGVNFWPSSNQMIVVIPRSRAWTRRGSRTRGRRHNAARGSRVGVGEGKVVYDPMKSEDGHKQDGGY